MFVLSLKKNIKIAAFSLLGLGACSETAMRSALYEPDYEDKPPATLDSQPQKSGEGIVTGTPSTPADFEPSTDLSLGLGEKPNSLSSSPRPRLPSNPTQLGMLSQVLSEKLMTQPKAELDSLSLELKTLRIREDLAEVHLEGYLVLRSQGPKVERLLNEGPVVLSAAGEQDLMHAQFRRGHEIFTLEMTRTRARSHSEVLRHPWQGTLYLIDNEIGRIPVAIMKGFVEHF
jgi:hypothetical protein